LKDKLLIERITMKTETENRNKLTIETAMDKEPIEFVEIFWEMFVQ